MKKSSDHPHPRYCFRRPGATAPSLAFSQSFWALTGRDIEIARSLEQACEAGFEYFEVGLREDRLTATQALLRQFPLKLIAQGWATSLPEVAVFVDRAVQHDAVAINLHLGHAYMTEDEAVHLISQVQHLTASVRLPLLLETHRGRWSQDLFRTGPVLARLPELAICLDVSHYIVAGETFGGNQHLFQQHVLPLLNRTALIHGRVSNGHSVQVRLDDPFTDIGTIASLWSRAMADWLKSAPRDAVFVFEPELGPPPYAYLDSNGVEGFNRSAETVKLIELAQTVWSTAQGTFTAAPTLGA